MEATSTVTTGIAPTGAGTPDGAAKRRVFADLVASGRFCRDTPLGSILHPGVVSFREIAEGDSLHVCIDADDKVSVHVDRFSPVSGGKEDGCCRYSVRAVAAHMLAHLVAQLRRLASGARGRHRCRLECELVEVDGEDVVSCAEVPAGPS